MRHEVSPYGKLGTYIGKMPESEIKKIVIIGAGNVATNLAQALRKAGFDIIQIYGRTNHLAKALADKVKSSYTSNLSDLNMEGDIYFISVVDSAFKNILKKINIDDKLIVHTSGSIPMNILNNTSKNYGVFYPLQTFSKQKKPDFENIPICLEANSDRNLKLLTSLAKTISKNVHIINSEQRAALHLSAVFACNFSNHMYVIAENILLKHNISFDMIKPLINETAKNIEDHRPHKVQTGPAKRGDHEIIAKHLELLADNPDFREIYKIITQNIIKYKNQTDKSDDKL
ncbi:MAG: DUF2520 domain-containing protein [Bacteroidales bacterium]|nr:DUF2520 domain-containing protein [Bacteroidales bacterium]